MSIPALGRYLAEFKNPETERAYRQASLTDALGLGRAALWIGGGVALLLGVNDVTVLGWTPAAALLIILRLCVALVSALLLLRFRRPITPAQFDRAMLAWAWMLQVYSGIAEVTRPANFTPGQADPAEPSCSTCWSSCRCACGGGWSARWAAPSPSCA
ncbi:MAG: hypothetical protein WDN69_10355 [Aliidongia sp.]